MKKDDIQNKELKPEKVEKKDNKKTLYVANCNFIFQGKRYYFGEKYEIDEKLFKEFEHLWKFLKMEK